MTVCRARRYVENNPHRSWANYSIGNHRRNGYVCEFTRSELAEAAKLVTHCRLCDTRLNWTPYTKRSRPGFDSPSLDRVDNGLTLSLATVQIICYRCNTTKGPRTMAEFVTYCAMVVERLRT